MRKLPRYILLLSILITCLTAISLYSQESASTVALKPLSAEQFLAVSSLFQYDSAISLDARVLNKKETDWYIREKIVFTGVRGDRVPGYLFIPNNNNPRHPLILLLHAGSASKETWLQSDGLERGKILSDTLLKLGFAIIALDAQYHGERAVNNDYLPIGTMFYNYKWFFRFRDGMIETAGDYFRVVDYLRTRPEIDLSRLGIVGYSMGGVTGFIFAAINQDVKAIVGCVAAVSEPWIYPLTPINMAQEIQAPTLLLAGRSDPFISVDKSERLYNALNAEQKKLEMLDCDHWLPDDYIDRTVNWITNYIAH